MDKNKRLTVWLPVIIAASIALGIFIGNHYLSISQGKKRSYSSGNKINAILDIIDEQYVDTVSMSKLVESTIPKIFSELDPHSVYIPAEDASVVNEELEGSFSGIGVSFNMQTDTILVISVISVPQRKQVYCPSTGSSRSMILFFPERKRTKERS